MDHRRLPGLPDTEGILAGSDDFRREETVWSTTVVPKRISAGMRAEPISGSWDNDCGFAHAQHLFTGPQLPHIGHSRELAAYEFTVDTRFFLGCSGGKDNARHRHVVSRFVRLDG